MAYKLFVDTDVYLDLLMNRGKDWEAAEAVFKLAERGVIEVFTSSVTIMSLMDIMNVHKMGRGEIAANTYAILSFTQLISPDNLIFGMALSSAFEDMDDAVQYHTALQVKGMSYFITSNVKAYKDGMQHLQVISPVQFIEKYNK